MAVARDPIALDRASVRRIDVRDIQHRAAELVGMLGCHGAHTALILHQEQGPSAPAC